MFKTIDLVTFDLIYALEFKWNFIIVNINADSLGTVGTVDNSTKRPPEK